MGTPSYSCQVRFRRDGCDWTEESGSAAAQVLRDSPGSLPTAIVAFNDRCAVGLLDAFIRAGIAVPADVSVVGYDDDDRLSPGLLQTEHYARAVIRAVRPGYDEESMERRVIARLARQKALLDREAPPELICVLNEAVVRRHVGDAHVRAGQLRALADAAERPRLTIQVLPFSAGAHAGLEGGFVLIESPANRIPTSSTSRGIMGDLYLESVEEVKRASIGIEAYSDDCAQSARDSYIDFGVGERTRLSGEMPIAARTETSRTQQRRSTP